MHRTHPRGEPRVRVRYVAIDREEKKRIQYEGETAYLRDHPLDTCKRPLGYFLNHDGSGAHDSEGNAVPLRREDEELAARRREEYARMQQAFRPMTDERTAALAAEVEQVNAIE